MESDNSNDLRADGVYERRRSWLERGLQANSTAKKAWSDTSSFTDFGRCAERSELALQIRKPLVRRLPERGDRICD